jgi:hypothetical protein
MSKLSFKFVGLILMLLFITGFFTTGCELGGAPVIENQLNQEIRISVSIVREGGTLGESIDYGVVPAQTTKKLAGVTFVNRAMVKRMEAKDLSGKVVFSHDYNMDDLEKIQWKITIPP